MNIMAPMSCTLPPSLEYRTSVKIAVTLWTNNNSAVSLADFRFQSSTCHSKRKEWQPIEDKIIEKVFKLPLPETMKKKIICFIRPIGIEILKWREYQDMGITCEKPFLRSSIANISWTPYGTVDIKRTAENLIRDESLDITRRFDVACVYCLEKDIPIMWEKIPKSKKKHFDCDTYLMPSLVNFWTCIVIGEGSRLERMIEKLQFHRTLDDYAFIVAVESGNKAAVEFFWQKLTPDTKERYFPLAMSIIAFSFREINSTCCFYNQRYYADMVCFLMTQASEELELLIKNRQCPVRLRCLLEWPHQSSFLEISKYIWPNLRLPQFEYVARSMIHKIEYGYKDYDYSELFRELWKNSPISYRRCFIVRFTLQQLLPPLFRIKDKETLSLVFRNVTSRRKVKAIFHRSGRDICISLARDQDWDLLTYFINVCLTSQERLITFREKFFKKRLTRSVSKAALETGEDITAKIYAFISELEQNYAKKRNLEDEISNCPSKKLCGRSLIV